jgi:hypothetical protein
LYSDNGANIMKVQLVLRIQNKVFFKSFMEFKTLYFRLKNKFLKSMVDFSVILVLFFIASFNLSF